MVNRPAHLYIHMYVYIFEREHFICVGYIIQYVCILITYTAG